MGSFIMRQTLGYPAAPVPWCPPGEGQPLLSLGTPQAGDSPSCAELCGDIGMCQLCCHTTHIGPPSLELEEAQDPAESLRQLSHPRGPEPCAAARSCSPGRVQGRGRATGVPAAPWGHQHPAGGAGRDTASSCALPHGTGSSTAPPARPTAQLPQAQPVFSSPERQLLHIPSGKCHFPVTCRQRPRAPGGGRAEPPLQLHAHPKHSQNPIIN